MPEVSLYVAAITAGAGLVGAGASLIPVYLRDIRQARQDCRDRHADARRQACLDLLRAAEDLRTTVANAADYHGEEMSARLAQIRTFAAAVRINAANLELLAPGTVSGLAELFRDSQHGAALQHLPSGYPQVNLAWMWGALLAASIAAWLHQLTATSAAHDILAGHGMRGGKAMIATLRWRLITVPGRLTRYARHLTLRLPPGHGLLREVLAQLRVLPAPA